MKKILKTDKYYIYCRTATIQDDGKKTSLDSQLDILEKYAQEHKLDIVGVFGDEGSMYDNFEHMMKNISYKDANCILVTDESRISRNPSFRNEIIEALENGTLDKVRTRTTIYQNDPESKLKLSFHFYIGDLEKKIISERIKKGIAYKKEKTMHT